MSSRSFEAMEELEELVYTDRHARELHNALLWPLTTWPRDVLLALYECDFDGVHRTLVQRSSGDILERVFNEDNLGEMGGLVAEGSM